MQFKGVCKLIFCTMYSKKESTVNEFVIHWVNYFILSYVSCLYLLSYRNIDTVII